MVTEDGTEDLPSSSSSLFSSCSNITYHKYEDGTSRGFIEASDCVNGTWVSGLGGREKYSDLVSKYEDKRRNKANMVKRRSTADISLIPWEEDITILPYVSNIALGANKEKHLKLQIWKYFRQKYWKTKRAASTLCQWSVWTFTTGQSENIFLFWSRNTLTLQHSNTADMGGMELTTPVGRYLTVITMRMTTPVLSSTINQRGLSSSYCCGAWCPEPSCSWAVSTCVSAASLCSLVMTDIWGFSAVARLSLVSLINIFYQMQIIIFIFRNWRGGCIQTPI